MRDIITFIILAVCLAGCTSNHKSGQDIDSINTGTDPSIRSQFVFPSSIEKAK
jgi:hypothetical protein